MPKARYWRLKNKDRIIHKFAEERTQALLNEFVGLVEKYCKGSYEDLYAIDQPLYYKSNQRLDFMMNVYQEVIKHSESKIAKLENERNRRRSWS
jgi:hypothetical protein